MSTYEALKELVVSGAIDPRKRASESQLASQLGVSRTPVREALQRLEGDGLVDAQGRGIRVRVMGSSEIADLLVARAGLEGWAAYLAAQRVADGMVPPVRTMELERLAKETDSLTRSGDVVGGADANREFHRKLAELSENADIVLTLASWWDRVTVSTRDTIRTPDRVEDVDHEHRLILQALKAGQPEAARKAVETHIFATRNTLLKL